MFITLSQNLTKFFHEEGTMHGLLYENKIGYTARKIFRNNKHKMPLSKSSMCAFYWQLKEIWSVLYKKDAGQPLAFNISNTKAGSVSVSTQLVKCCSK